MSNCWPLTSPGFFVGSVSPVFSLKVYMRSISYLRHSRFVSNSLPSEAVYLPMVGLVFRWCGGCGCGCRCVSALRAVRSMRAVLLRVRRAVGVAFACCPIRKLPRLPADFRLAAPGRREPYDRSM